MDIGSIFLVLALVLLVVLFISRPFITRSAAAEAAGEAAGGAQAHRFSALLAERDRVLAALQELDFDNALGKIPQEDYPAQRASLMQAGAAVLSQLDELQALLPETNAGGRLKTVLAAPPLEKPAAASASQSDDDLEERISARRRLRAEKTSGFCPKCGNPVKKSDVFCSHCGATVKPG